MRMFSSYKTACAGMTLIEVLVALFIIAIAMSAAIRSVNTGVVNTEQLVQRSVAHWVAMNAATELQLRQSSGGYKGDEEWQEADMANRTWHIKTKGFSTDDKNVLRVETRVFRAREDASPVISLTSYIGVSK